MNMRKLLSISLGLFQIFSTFAFVAEHNDARSFSFLKGKTSKKLKIELDASSSYNGKSLQQPMDIFGLGNVDSYNDIRYRDEHAATNRNSAVYGYSDSPDVYHSEYRTAGGGKRMEGMDIHGLGNADSYNDRQYADEYGSKSTDYGYSASRYSHGSSSLTRGDKHTRYSPYESRACLNSSAINDFEYRNSYYGSSESSRPHRTMHDRQVSDMTYQRPHFRPSESNESFVRRSANRSGMISNYQEPQGNFNPPPPGSNMSFEMNRARSTRNFSEDNHNPWEDPYSIPNESDRSFSENRVSRSNNPLYMSNYYEGDQREISLSESRRFPPSNQDRNTRNVSGGRNNPYGDSQSYTAPYEFNQPFSTKQIRRSNNQSEMNCFNEDCEESRRNFDSPESSMFPMKNEFRRSNERSGMINYYEDYQRYYNPHESARSLTSIDGERDPSGTKYYYEESQRNFNFPESNRSFQTRSDRKVSGAIASFDSQETRFRPSMSNRSFARKEVERSNNLSGINNYYEDPQRHFDSHESSMSVSEKRQRNPSRMDNYQEYSQKYPSPYESSRPFTTDESGRDQEMNNYYEESQRNIISPESSRSFQTRPKRQVSGTITSFDSQETRFRPSMSNRSFRRNEDRTSSDRSDMHNYYEEPQRNFDSPKSGAFYMNRGRTTRNFQ